MICYHLTRQMDENIIQANNVIRKKGISCNTAPPVSKENAQKLDVKALSRCCWLFKCEISDLLKFTDEER